MDDGGATWRPGEHLRMRLLVRELLVAEVALISISASVGRRSGRRGTTSAFLIQRVRANLDVLAFLLERSCMVFVLYFYGHPHGRALRPGRARPAHAGTRAASPHGHHRTARNRRPIRDRRRSIAGSALRARGRHRARRHSRGNPDHTPSTGSRGPSPGSDRLAAPARTGPHTAFDSVLVRAA